MNKSSIYKELTHDELRDVLGAHIDGGFSASVLTGGMFNTTYLVNMSDSGKKYVLRAGPVNRHLLLPFEQQLFEAEDYFYSLCRDAGVPVPNIIALDTSRKLTDRDYMITEHIESVALSEANLSEDEKNAAFQTTGTYAKKIHSITGPRFGRLADVKNGKGFEKWSDYLKHEIDDFIGYGRHHGIYTDTELEEIKNIFVTYADLLDEITVPHLIHSDLWAGNVLISKDQEHRVAAIIDADRALFGDSDMELASEWMINDAFIEGYGAPLNMDEKSVTRRKIYSLFFNIMDSLVCKVEYNNTRSSLINKSTALSLIYQLMQR